MGKLLPSLVLASALVLTACSSPDDENGSSQQDQHAKSTESQSQSVIGTWKQEDSASEDGWMEASITDDVITVEWTFDNGKNRSIYWIGSFDAETAAAGETITSKRDIVATDTALMAASADEKDFKVDGDTLSFDVAIQDVTLTAILKKISDDPTTVNSLKGTDSNRSFKDNVLEVPAATIKITDHRIIPTGEPGNEDGEKPLIVFYYDVTNKSDAELSALDFVQYFTAIQDNNSDTVNELEVGSFYDPELTDSLLEKIKKDGTASGAVAYELDDESTPVELVAKDNFGQNEIGRQTFELDSSVKK